MSENNWGGHLTLVGIVALVLIVIGAVASPHGPYRQTNNPVGAQKAPDRGEGLPPERADDVSTDALLLRLTRAIEAIRSNEESPDKARHESADLVAQQEMAMWALGMLLATGAQGILGLFTVIYLVRTFSETRRSADASVKAAQADYRSEVIAGFAFSPDQKHIVIPGRSYGQHVSEISIAAFDLISNIGQFALPLVKPRQVYTSIASGESCEIFKIPFSCTDDQKFCRGYVRWTDGIGVKERRVCVQVRRRPPDNEFQFITVGGELWNHVIDDRLIVVEDRSTRPQ